MTRFVVAALVFLSHSGAGLPAAEPASKLETLLLLPEPRELRSELSLTLPGAVKTVLSPAYETAERPGLVAYAKREFTLLGISLETFRARAQSAADRLLAAVEPEVIKDGTGKPLYAVVRSDRPVIACLLVAPSLARRFEKLFGPEIWVAVPDRHSLFVFPPNPTVLADYADDLAGRYAGEAFAASAEVFALGANAPLKVVGAFDRQ